MKKQKIILLCGPTGIGKTALSVKIAKEIDAGIIGADSMQIYKYLNIGTGKIKEEEKQNVPHYLIDFIKPDTEYSTAMYVSDVKKAIGNIASQNKNILITGGTGFYINALLNGYELGGVGKDEKIREKWGKFLDENGIDSLYKSLTDVDYAAAEKINKNDTKRVIRALEMYELTGKCRSQQKALGCEYDYLLIILECERAKLYENINKRVDKMFEEGLLNEAKNLLAYKNCNSMQAIGYKQIFDYLEKNEIDIEKLKNDIKQKTRNYAKRQITYFKSMNVPKVYFEINEYDLILNKINNFLLA